MDLCLTITPERFAMPKYVRVHDRDTKTDSSILASTAHLGNYEVLDEDALNELGDPRPPSPHESLSSKSSGQKATDKKES